MLALDRQLERLSAVTTRAVAAFDAAGAWEHDATRSATTPAGGRRPEPLFTVLVGYETFSGPICELANGAMVTPGSLLPWLESAWAERVVFDGSSRVIDVGVRQRLFTGATRRAVEVRDRECFHEFCDVPAELCEIDNVRPMRRAGSPRRPTAARPAHSTTGLVSDNEPDPRPNGRGSRMCGLADV